MIVASKEVPNLQLLTPAENESKGGRFPGEWLTAAFPDGGHRAAIEALHHYGSVGDALDGFDEFIASRREMLTAVVRQRLGVPSPTSV
jgi:hypothetical protein